MSQIVGVVQVRVNSTRLPKKSLLPLAGKALFLRTWERLSLTPGLQPVIVATSHDPSNDIIEMLCAREGIGCVRGASGDVDVLTRFLAVLDAYRDAEAVARITPDCPFTDASLVSAVVGAFRRRPVDYASNVLIRTYPNGLDAEVISADCLRWLDRHLLAHHRENFTQAIWEGGRAFSCATVTREQDLSDLQWTVDKAEDLEFVRWAWERLPEGFHWTDVLALKNDPQLPPAMRWRFEPELVGFPVMDGQT